MVRVHYYLLGEWYAVDMPDMPTALSFACDFLEYWFEDVKIGDDFCLTKTM